MKIEWLNGSKKIPEKDPDISQWIDFIKAQKSTQENISAAFNS